MVKLFIPAKSKADIATGLEDYTIERKFGKAPMFLIIDPETKEFQLHQNENKHMGGKGCTWESVVNNGAEVAIAAHMGPGAFNNLKKKNIKLLRGDLNITMDKIIEKYNSNELSDFPEPKDHDHHHDH